MSFAALSDNFLDNIRLISSPIGRASLSGPPRSFPARKPSSFSLPKTKFLSTTLKSIAAWMAFTHPKSGLELAIFRRRDVDLHPRVGAEIGLDQLRVLVVRRLVLEIDQVAAAAPEVVASSSAAPPGSSGRVASSAPLSNRTNCKTFQWLLRPHLPTFTVT